MWGEWLWRSGFALGLALFFAIGGLRKGSLSTSGAIGAVLVGLLTCLAGFRMAATLILFFLSSSFVTRLNPEKKRRIEDGFKHGGQRDWRQVAANGATGTLLCVLMLYLIGPGDFYVNFQARPFVSLLLAAFLGHYACCNGDTWASEIGVLSKTMPRLITTWKKVKCGTNGGVSLLGTSACILGGLFIGLVFYMGGLLFAQPEPVPQWPLIFLGLFAGIFGSMMDSLLGATLQYSGYCPERNRVVNEPGPRVQHICGLNILDNNQVNFFSALITSVATAGLAWTAMA